MENSSPVEKAAHIVGGLTTLARMLGVSPPTVHEWKTYKRPVPAGRCMAIHRATNGQVSLQSLRPDDWQDYWPELAQSPANTQHTATETVAHRWLELVQR